MASRLHVTSGLFLLTGVVDALSVLGSRGLHSKGVRDGTSGADTEGAPVTFGDGSLDRNLWLGMSKSLDLHVLDDLEPIAPLDSVNPPAHVASLSPEPLPAENHNSKFIAPYGNPDAFPVVDGPHCMCTKPVVEPPTEKQLDWAEDVARQLGIHIDDMPKPMAGKDRVRCTCKSSGNETGNGEWFRAEAIPGTNNFTLLPSDVSYPDGDHWSPKVKDGIVAPADIMPSAHYPIQAAGDRISHLPAMAREDRIGLKFARYMDQVEHRSNLCEGDGVSENCVVDCRPGDEVQTHFGQLIFNGSVLTTYLNGGLLVEVNLTAAKDALGTTPCPVERQCTPFRPCLEGTSCVQKEATHSFDYLGELQQALRCPIGTQQCSSIQQIVGGRFLKKDGKNCRAAPIVKPLPA